MFICIVVRHLFLFFTECSPKYDCVELGAGTGKLTMKLIKELPKVGNNL